MKLWRRVALVSIPALVLSSSVSISGIQERSAPTSDDCSFLQHPDDFLHSPEEHWREVTDFTDRLGNDVRMERSQMTRFSAAAMPRKNFIDDYIFGRMERDGIQPAPLADDQVFLRRVMLDLTGRIPSPEQVTAFAYDSGTAKYDAIVDALVGNGHFIDKWTMFLGDLYEVNAASTSVNRYPQGRDAFYMYLLEALTLNKPYNQIAHELINASGDSFTNGPANFIVGGTIPMGPVQDTYDGQAANVARMFLGVNVVDCLLCHDGARHLDTVNLWGKQETRVNAWGLSAFFAQTRMQNVTVSQNPTYISRIVSDQPGEYLLNTRIGNRTARQPIGGVNRILPRFPFNGETVPAGANRRTVLADIVTYSPQFSRAIVNYVWEKLMVEAFVTPSNGFDPARLDPQNPPPAPWTLQPTNPELLEALSQWFRQNNYDLRELMRLITKSNAYRLSSEYEGTWKPEYVPYYARKYVRRLDAEEVHDAITTATGILPTYTLGYQNATYPLAPVNYAMQLPDTREPRSNAASVQFLNAFGRGDRDVTRRDSSESQMQALNMMNHAFVMNRIGVNNNGSNVQRLTRQYTEPLAIIEGLYLSTLSRFPYPGEITVSADTMRRLGNQRGAEALQWALLNKLEFLFSY